MEGDHDDHDDGTWGVSANYSLLIKGFPRFKELALDEATPPEPWWSVDWQASARQKLVAKPAYSTDTRLHFAPVALPTTGTYKVCFCDADLLDGGDCQKASDFSIE